MGMNAAEQPSGKPHPGGWGMRNSVSPSTTTTVKISPSGMATMALKLKGDYLIGVSRNGRHVVIK
jgi:hypothetical protein